MTVPIGLAGWEPSSAMVRLRDQVAEAFFVSPGDVTGRGRMRHLVTARNAACWVVRARFGLSFPCIGKLIGGRDHSTMVHAWHNAEALRERDPAFRQRTDDLVAGVAPAQMAPLPAELVAPFIPVPPSPPQPAPEERIEGTPAWEFDMQAARDVRPRNKFHGDADARNRFVASKKLEAAIAASGGRFL